MFSSKLPSNVVSSKQKYYILFFTLIFLTLNLVGHSHSVGAQTENDPLRFGEITASNPNPVLVTGQDVFTVELEMVGGTCPQVERTQPVDVVLVLDVSSSMNRDTSDGVPRIDAAVEAAQAFVREFTVAPRPAGAPTPTPFPPDTVATNPYSTVDQVALVTFGDDAEIVSGQPTPDLAFLSNEQDLVNILGGITTDGSTNMAQGIDFANRILSGSGRNLEGDAVPVIVILTDGEPDEISEVQAEIAALRRRHSPRVVAIGLESDDLNASFMESIADEGNYFTAGSADDLRTVYTEVAALVQPITAAENLVMTFTVNPGYTLRNRNIQPIPQTVTENSITWSNLSSINRGESVNYSFEVQANSDNIAGGDVGTAIVNYSPCQDTTGQQLASVGPFVQPVLPTATPTSTSTATPTHTPTPTNTPPPTPPAFTQEGGGTTIASSGLGGITATLCDPSMWDYLPLVGAILLLLFALFFLYRSWQSYNKSEGEVRDLVCFLLKIPAALYPVFLAFIFLQPVVGQVCDIPESVYFWRLDASNQGGIFITNENLAEDEAPAQISSVNEVGCVGCHSTSATSSSFIGTTGPVPGRAILTDINDSEANVRFIDETDAVYTALSPDGTRVAISTGSGDLVIVDFSGVTEPITLTLASDADFAAIMPAWSANGEELAYVRVPRSNLTYGLIASGTSDIYIINAANTETRALVTQDVSEGLNYYPSFSPDGRWLAYTNHNNPSQSTYSAPSADIWLMDLTNLFARPIDSNDATASDSWASWNNDGSRLSFNTTRFDPTYDIVIVDVDETGATSNLVTLPGASNAGVFEHLPAWGLPAEREALFPQWLALVPWLLPWLLFLGLSLMCSFWPRKKLEVETDVVLPVYPKVEPIQPNRNLESWNGIRVLWEPQPALVVGVGAAGWHVLTQLKKTLSDAGLGTISDKVKLLAIIPGEQDSLYTKNTFTGMLLDDDEMINLRDPLNSTLDASQDDPALAWVDRDYIIDAGGGVTDPRIGFNNNRTLGRLALIHNLRGNTEYTEKSIWETIRTLGREAQNQGILNTIVIGDSSDAVGSGMYLDISYMIQRLRDVENIPTIRQVGHVLTSRVAGNSDAEDAVLSVNTGAFMRELSRFQLASNTNFPMSFSEVGATPEELNSNWNRPLFDEIYVHDGEGMDEDPQKGVYPAVADVVGIWLDSAAKTGDLDKWRASMGADKAQAQRNQGSMMVSALGIYQYRLPFADYLANVTVKFARELLQYLLMGQSESRPVWTSENANDELGNDPTELARRLIKRMTGIGALREDWSFLFLGLITNDEKLITKTLKKIEVDADEDLNNWREWLASQIDLILMGRVSEDEQQDVVNKRSAKIGLAYEFLNYLCANGGLLTTFNNTLAQINPIAEVDEMIKGYIRVTAEMREQLKDTGLALGIDVPKGSLYELLANLEDDLSLRTDIELTTRTYIEPTINGRTLVDVWYDKYILQTRRIQDALRQIQWETDASTQKTQLRLVLPKREDTDEVEDIIFNADNIEEFEDKLLELCQYFLQDIREKESISDILNQDLLHDDNLDDTVVELESNSNMLVTVNLADNLANFMRRGVVLSASEEISRRDDLVNGLSGRLKNESDLKLLDTTDPFTVTVVQTQDVVSQDLLTNLVQDKKRFITEIFDSNNAQPTVIYLAENEASFYERSLNRVDEPSHPLHPLLISALSRPKSAKGYLLSAAIAYVSEDDVSELDWQLIRGESLVFDSEETQRQELLNQQQILSPKFGILVDGLYAFQAVVSEEIAQELLDFYTADPDMLALLRRWEQQEQTANLDSSYRGDTWLKEHQDVREEVLKDYIAVTRREIIRILQGN